MQYLAKQEEKEKRTREGAVNVEITGEYWMANCLEERPGDLSRNRSKDVLFALMMSAPQRRCLSAESQQPRAGGRLGGLWRRICPPGSTTTT